MRPYAQNFDELMAALASESPHAVVLDWFRRLNLTSKDYKLAHGIRSKDFDASLRADQLVGPCNADAYQRLRALRNQVAHTEMHVTSQTAVLFAGQALCLIGALSLSTDERRGLTRS